jgi:hypothetical protein
MKSVHHLDAIVRKYQRDNLAKASRELDAFRAMTFDDAVSHAGLAERFDRRRNRWLRYDHQRRIPRASLQIVRERLRTAPLKQCSTFDELLAVVDEATRQIPKVGELMVYDTALRIGANLGIEPDRVYLHAGTRVGARKLGLLRPGAHWIARRDLPEPLRSLPPWLVEDILCIFKVLLDGQIGLAG